MIPACLLNAPSFFLRVVLRKIKPFLGKKYKLFMELNFIYFRVDSRLLSVCEFV